MNIVWEKENGELAMTSVFAERFYEVPDDSPGAPDGALKTVEFDVQSYAASLQAQGDIPAGWSVVATNYAGAIPTERQEAWRWKNGAIVADAMALKKLSVPASVSRRKLKLALHASGLLAQIEAYVSNAPIEVQISWAESLDFERGNAMLLAAATALGKSETDLDDLFILAGSL